MEPTTTLGRFIRERRDAMGWTQTELADRAGINRAVLAQIETGKIKLPSAEFRRALADALSVRHLDLLMAAGELFPHEIEDADVVPSLIAPLIGKIERLRVADREALSQILDTMLGNEPGKMLNAPDPPPRRAPALFPGS